MEKKLPKVYVNEIDKDINNNKKVYSSTMMDDEKELISEDPVDIYKKIQSIFSSPKYVYKADVSIKTNEGLFLKKIVGKNNKYLITIDNELIPIADIIDINYNE